MLIYHLYYILLSIYYVSYYYYMTYIIYKFIIREIFDIFIYRYNNVIIIY